jgi:hypothetical protein
MPEVEKIPRGRTAALRGDFIDSRNSFRKATRQ